VHHAGRFTAGGIGDHREFSEVHADHAGQGFDGRRERVRAGLREGASSGERDRQLDGKTEHRSNLQADSIQRTARNNTD
jgi:hypothetical protein